MDKKPRVLLGMSGGVDSSVSAVLLLEQGYEVIGGFMKNWSEGDDEDCGWKTERRDAMRVAAQLGIEFHTFDFEKEYREKVYEYMIAEYKAGRTPNPDVLCNKYMKFDLFLQKADELGCDYVATGHYARVARDADGAAHLLAGKDSNKDQSYFLCQLTQEQIRRALFPIGELLKPEVREIAKKHGLAVADKKDSQGICFVGKVQMREFLKERIAEHEGNIVTTEGEIIGTHKGFEFHTVGQREGLGIGGGIPYFVVERRPETNELIVAVGDQDPALYKKEFGFTQATEAVPGALAACSERKIEARIRYRQPLAACRIENGRVFFDEPQRAVAPGQFIAFYDGEELLGSGVIVV